jgi:3-oxoacyl-[acyl-carrier protein] reductase
MSAATARARTPAWGLAGKTVIVTGASSGIGAATGAALASVGAGVMLVGRDEERLRASAGRARGHGARVETSLAELSDPAAAAGVVGETVERFGSLHGIVHAAGVTDAGSMDGSALDVMGRQWRINLLAPLLMTQAALPHLQPGSALVFVGSTVGIAGFPSMADYAATKGGVHALTRALAVELAPRGIRVNILLPGYVRTPMVEPDLAANEGYEEWIHDRTPLRRIGDPEELAAAAVFLLSDLASYVHGTSLVADGGWTAQ